MRKITSEVEKPQMHLRIINGWICLYKGLSYIFCGGKVYNYSNLN